MSAWIVSKDTIDLMVSAALDAPYGLYWGKYPDLVKIERSNARMVGRRLWTENHRSVNYRYDEDTPVPLYVFRDVGMITVRQHVVVLKTIDCYEYQSCEHPGWEDSDAYQFCQTLRRSVVGRLPGYNDAPWGWDRPAPDIEKVRAR